MNLVPCVGMWLILQKLRDQIRHWMSVWFFLKARHGESIERFEDRMLQGSIFAEVYRLLPPYAQESD
jgi:macrodomain Ter protein organizer (MatP/YcbG family)